VIGRLTGRLESSEADGTLLVDVGGVGYEVSAPLGTAGRAAAPDGSITLHVHTHVREDALELFGFASATDRIAFRTLLGVSHVGPKLALSVLGALDVTELTQAIEREDAPALKRIPGVGLKTAQRIVLELKGKLTGLAVGASVKKRTTPAPMAPAGAEAQLLDALVRMGWKNNEAERAVATMIDFDRPLAELLREALGTLSR
jgi:Holliday junction DNA helicase RuvA